MAKFQVTPIGEFQHPWINKPDTKFNEDGVYKVDLVIEGEEAEKLKADLKAQADEAFETLLDKKTPAEKKKWSPLYPFEDEEDDEGNATGRTIFKFKQNYKLKVKGEEKTVTIEIRDAKDRVVTARIFGGTEGRIMFSTRAIEVSGQKTAGIRLDFAKVQVTKLQKSSGGGFGAVDGGWSEDGKAAASGGADEEAGDY